MSPDRRERPHFPIPEMPGKEHLPTLVRLLNIAEPRVAKLRDELYHTLQERRLNKTDRDFIVQMTALAYHLHRKEERITGGPYIIHPLEVAIDMARDKFIPKRLLPRAIAGAVLHDAVEDNKFVTFEKLTEVAGEDVASDVEVYSRKSASDKAERVDTQLSEEDYLRRILNALPHVKRGKVRDRIRNLLSMPADETHKMYDKYFSRDREAFILIIKSLGPDGQTLYEEYKNAHDANKPADIEDLPIFEKIAA